MCEVALENEYRTKDMSMRKQERCIRNACISRDVEILFFVAADVYHETRHNTFPYDTVYRIFRAIYTSYFMYKYCFGIIYQPFSVKYGFIMNLL